MTKVRQRVLRGCKCITGWVCGCRKKGIKCSEGCQCTNCENIASPSHDREEVAHITLEEAAVTNQAMDKEGEEEFAEFMFGAAFDHSDVDPEITDD